MDIKSKFVMDTDNGDGPKFLFRINRDGTTSIATLEDLPKYNIKYKLTDNVRILPLDGDSGMIMSIHIGDEGIAYKVRYFTNGEAKEVFFYEWELSD